jgi:hypothetical protein
MDSTEFGSSEAATQGGLARAKSMSAEDRRESARVAAEARWGPIPKATHAGTLAIGNLKLDCAVLDTSDRVLSARGFSAALGLRFGANPANRFTKSGIKLPVFLSFQNLKPFISPDLEAILSDPIRYRTPGGKPAHGLRADLIPKVCEVWLSARDAGALRTTQLKVAHQADIIVRGLAHVGIVALVDEATGFQDDRDRRALAKILEAFVAKELRPWVHTFPVDYYRELYRLRNLQYPPKGNKMPQYIGMLTNDIVYRRIAPGVLAELRRIVPRDNKGRLKHHLHRRLTDDVGHPKLLQHLGSVVTLMKLSDDGDYAGFQKLLDKVHPRHADAPLFEDKEQKLLTVSE